MDEDFYNDPEDDYFSGVSDDDFDNEDEEEELEEESDFPDYGDSPEDYEIDEYYY